MEGVRDLVELICKRKATIPKKMEAHSSIPSSLLTEDFSKKLFTVLRLGQHIKLCQWGNYFDFFSRDMLSSHGKYIAYVMMACFLEHKLNKNIFDSFISVCVLVINLKNETLTKTGVDFSDLNPDIIMVFYRNVMKSYFHGRRDLYRFIEYIRTHKYLEMNLDENDLDLSHDAYLSVFHKKEINDFIINEALREESAEEISDMKYSIKGRADSWTREVLSFTTAELPALPSEPDLITRLVAYRKKEIAKTKKSVEAALTFQTSHGNSNSNNDSKTNYFAKQQGDIARHERIIQAVISHNNSKKSGHVNTNDKMYVEANEIFEHMKNRIKSLTEVLE